MVKSKSQKSPTGRSPGRRSHSRAIRPVRTRSSRSVSQARLQSAWADGIQADQWELYRSAIQAMRDAGIRFLLGGGFALAAYIGRWRNTKDIDLYVLKEDRQAAIDALAGAGFKDYFDQLPYDRKWIYRSTHSGVIVDIIWAMANQRAETDELWFQRSLPIQIRGESLQLVPLEEFMWCKLYILQRDHCDWTDVFNLLYGAGNHLDWNHLLWRLEEDSPLLKGLLQVYGWLCPRRAQSLPNFLRQRLKLEPPAIPKLRTRDRIRLLDTRGWFAALLNPDQPLEV